MESGGNGQQTEAGHAYGHHGLVVWGGVYGPWDSAKHGGVRREEGEKNYYAKRRLDIYNNGGIRAQEMAIKVACEIGSLLRHEFQKR